MPKSTPQMVPEPLALAERFVDTLPHLLLALQKAWQSHPSSGGLTLRQAQALTVLSHSDSISVNRLCSELGIAQSTGSELLERMSRTGIITRKPNQSDKRSATLSISAAGREALQAWRASRVRSFAERFDRLDPQERTSLLSDLKSTASVLEKISKLD